MLQMTIAILLIVWLIYDLISGTVWGDKKYYRQHSPKPYWLFMLLWTCVAAISAYYAFL